MVNSNRNIKERLDLTEDITKYIDSRKLNISGYAISDDELRLIDDGEFGEDEDGGFKELNFDTRDG